MVSAEHPPGTAALPAAVARRLRLRLGLSRAARFQPFTGGRSARSYLLCDRDRHLVVKLARTETGGRLFPIRPKVEWHVLRRLSRSGLAADPQDLFFLGRDLVLVCAHRPGTVGRPPDPALARLLRQLHDHPLTGLHRLLPRAPDLCPPLLDRAFRHLARDPASAPLVEAIRSARRNPAPAPARLLHGDPVPGNVIATPAGPGLIDWQCAQQGDPCRDLALALSPAMQVIHGLPPLTPDAIDVFLRAYGHPAIAARLADRAPVFHGEMIGHCLWRLSLGDAAYAPALSAEIAALAALAPGTARAAALPASEHPHLQNGGESEGRKRPGPGPEAAQLP